MNRIQGRRVGRGLGTRGIVRTGGFVPNPIAGAAFIGSTIGRGKKEAVLGAEKLPELLGELRRQVDGFPLTVVIERWDHPEAKKFWPVLKKHLAADDAVWFLGIGDDAPPRGCYLNLEKPEDKSFSKVLVADVLFLAVSGPEELESCSVRWTHRVKSLIALSHDDPSFSWVEGFGIPHYWFRWRDALMQA